MVPASLPPAVALIAGAAAGISSPLLAPSDAGFAAPSHLVPWALAFLAAAAVFAWRRRSDRVTAIFIVLAFGCAGAALGGDARATALDTPLRAQLDREFGGFSIHSFDVPGAHGPIPARLLLSEDASSTREEGAATTLRGQVLAIRLRNSWIDSDGGVVVSVGGAVSAGRAAEWRRGRTIEAPITFRRPARYLDDGVADFEEQDALDGVTLLGSIKSGLLIEVVRRGTILSEAAADARAYVRDRVSRRVVPHSALSAAVVAAVLIGDRSGLPHDIRTRLQAAGTYHVIAISGGNIAILAGMILLALAAIGTSGRRAAIVTIIALIGYAAVVTAGPSVWRATLVAIVYLVARLLDLRSGPWQAMAVAGGLLVCMHPLDVRNVGFILTFGATAALLEVSRRLLRRLATGAQRHGEAGVVSASLRLCGSWVLTSIAASAAVEIALLPVMASTFARVTSAGLFLNLLAVPMMAAVQIAGMAIACADWFDALAWLAGWIGHVAAAGIIESARLVDVAPWLTRRVPGPPAVLILAYYSGLAVMLACRHALCRACGAVCLVIAGLMIVTGTNPRPSRTEPASLRLTMFDVGQGDAMVLEIGDQALMVDTGGSPFGGGAFDIGVRVVEPALWAIGVRSLATMLLTHGDPDHIGGAASLIDDFRPAAVWQGVPVPRAVTLQEVLAHATPVHSRVEERRTGEEFALGGARILVLHPPQPDWERQKVRNDDSVVLEIVYGDVALLLTGDIGSEVERDIAPRLIPAKTRILKVAHHGSRTSTSQELLDAWRPQIALISCGRGNPFGHPAPEVVERLNAAGVAIYRTDRDGEISLRTDGEDVLVKTFTGDHRLRTPVSRTERRRGEMSGEAKPQDRERPPSLPPGGDVTRRVSRLSTP